MKYVLDSCVGIKWALVEQHTDQARRIRDDYRNKIHELLSPDIYPIECTHALTRAERQGRITPVQGAVLLKDLLKMLPHLHPSLPLLPRAYEISSTMRIGIYDCLYVALAEQEGCELVTADIRLVSSLRAAFPFILDLTTFP